MIVLKIFVPGKISQITVSGHYLKWLIPIPHIHLLPNICEAGGSVTKEYVIKCEFNGETVRLGGSANY